MRKWFVALAAISLVRCASEPVDPAPEAPGAPPGPRTGAGAWTYEAVPGWGADLKGPTHGAVVIDKAGNVYVTTDNEKGIFVFSPEGALLRTMAAPFKGIHQMVLREEDGVEYLYGAHLLGRQAVKLTLEGEPVWTLGCPMESGHYQNANQFNPTSVAVAPDGSIFVADGYGTSFIHKFGPDRKFIKSFGQTDAGLGRLNCCHSIAIDTRGGAPMLLVCDRENRRLLHFDLDGNFVAVLATNLRRPSSIAFFGDIMAIVELEARVVLLDRNNQIVTTLGDNPDRSQWANFGVPPAAWKDEIFTAPHCAAFDRSGNLYVQDWNATGRVRKLSRASVSLPAPFGDHMVLQRDRRVPVWGWARPGARVTVRIADQTRTGKAGADGQWSVAVGPFPAGGPHELSVTSGETLTLHDVLVGEVWVCSGQSNMEWPVQATKDAKEEIAAAAHPQIRLFTVTKFISAAPRDTCWHSGWAECTPETVKGFSAVAYFFGRERHEKLHIPVGLIHSSWGGTVCEAWTSAGALRQLADFKPAIEEMESALTNLPALTAKYERDVAEWQRKVRALDPGYPDGGMCWSDPKTDTSLWKSMDLPKMWDGDLTNYLGSIWFRHDVEIPDTWAGKDLALSLGPIDDEDVTWFDGTRVGGLEGPGHWATPRRYKIPAKLVTPGRHALVVRMLNTGGPGGTSGKPGDLKLACGKDTLPLAGPWAYRVGLDLKKVPPAPQPPAAVRDPNSPTALFNAMIAPLIPYGIEGAIWYQGESNASRALQYRKLFPTMIRDWRSRWGQGDFKFLFVQLANFMAVKTEPGESAWAELRESQTMTLSLPKTGMAVAIDIGDGADIHPRNKQAVGKRLAAAADGKSGPIFKSMKVERDWIRVRFDFAGGGLAAKDGSLKGFAIAGSDGKFVWADASIEGEAVVVRSDRVPSPVAVRYAWADNPEGCNLYNKEGLPASPFRTDRP